jgi:aminopeptidase N
MIGQRIIDVFSFARTNGNESWKHSTRFLKDVVNKFSNWIGPYPYPVVTAVEGPANDRIAGMEYPMITLITNAHATERELDGLFAHEVGHNWFYGILASNERTHPWMDEGMNCFFQFRYEAEKYRWNSFLKELPDHIVKATAEEYLFNVLYQINKWPLKSPIETPATDFKSMTSYSSIVYLKAAVWMGLLEASVGKENFNRAFKIYYSQWKFRHPYPEDFRKSMELTLQRSLKDIFDLLHKRGTFK